MTVTFSEQCRIPLAHFEPPLGAAILSMTSLLMPRSNDRYASTDGIPSPAAWVPGRRSPWWVPAWKRLCCLPAGRLRSALRWPAMAGIASYPVWSGSLSQAVSTPGRSAPERVERAVGPW